MLTGEAAFHLGTLEVLLGDLLLKIDDAVQHGLRFGSDVHGARAGLVLVQGCLRSFQLLAYGWHLLIQELQALGGFGGISRDVLVYITAGDLFQNANGVLRVGVFEGHVDDARLLAAFGGRQTLLVAFRGVVGTVLDHGERGTRACVQLSHGDAVVLCLDRLANDTLNHDLVVLVTQDEAVVLCRFECQLLAMDLVRHFQLSDLQRLATPGVSAQTGRVPT